MKITNRQEAAEAIKALGEFIELEVEKGDIKNPMMDEPEIADLVRDWCRELLLAAEANGLNSCPLCQS